jgi:hypothetical protein
VEGTSQYNTLLKDLSLAPIEREPWGIEESQATDPFDVATIAIWGTFHIRRFLNRLFFRPATPEIRILADMVSKLRAEVETRMGIKIKGAALASPDRAGLTAYEMADVFEYLRMEDLVTDHYDPAIFRRLSSMAAAMAGYGEELCLNYTNVYQCAKEESRFPVRHILHLDYNNSTLSGGI